MYSSIFKKVWNHLFVCGIHLSIGIGKDSLHAADQAGTRSPSARLFVCASFLAIHYLSGFAVVLDDLHVLSKCNVVLDFCGGRRRIPICEGDAFAQDFPAFSADAVVVGQSSHGWMGCVGGLHKVLGIQWIWRKVMPAIYHNSLVGVRQYYTVPYSFHGCQALRLFVFLFTTFVETVLWVD